jgi:hypothetical protein
MSTANNTILESLSSKYFPLNFDQNRQVGLRRYSLARWLVVNEACSCLVSPEVRIERTTAKFNGLLSLLSRSGQGLGSRRRGWFSFSQSRLDGDLPFFPVVQSAALICRLWCVSLPYLKFDTNLMPKRGSTPLPETGVSDCYRWCRAP